MTMQIIRNRTIVDDDFVHVPDGAELPDGKPIVTLARYLAAREELLARYPALGVRIASDKLPTDIPELTRLALIAIEFPRFTDGRGYSVARMLRERHKFTGELRAVGWVLRDNLFYMERCGFTAFELKPGKPLNSALEAFGELSVTYQAATDEKRPIYRRR
ncbi:MAG TPA: DUF934 domain-containing protein [Kofleriaceae bacterium]|nr:DUF934 domain-containing protein [Kofleriaceae bacterium]